MDQYIKKKLAKNWFKTLQEVLCREIEEKEGKKTKFKKPIAHGLFGLSLIEGLKSETGIYEQTSIASLGWDEVRFLKPIFANDTVFAKYIFIKKRKSQKPGRGIVTEKVQLLNQHNNVVVEGTHTTLLISRSDEQ